MAKHRNFSPVIQALIDLVTSYTRYDPDYPNGYKVKKKKQVKPACCHMIMKDGRSKVSTEPKVMLEEDEVEGTVHCLVCDRVFPRPDINSDNLSIIHQAVGIINGAITLLAWSNIGKKDAQLLIETRNNMEQFEILYKSALDDISMAKINNTDTSMKSHVGRL